MFYDYTFYLIIIVMRGIKKKNIVDVLNLFMFWNVITLGKYKMFKVQLTEMISSHITVLQVFFIKLYF